METAILDKQLTSGLGEDYGKVGIRVVVFAKTQSTDATKGDEQPVDLEETEDFSANSEVNSFLESPKRGKMCCVFLVNGQRHEGLDNSFIVNDLRMKYLRKRMIIVVDLDALTLTAIAEIMQGGRTGFFDGKVYDKIRKRLTATLQTDPDLLALEEEAEEEVSQLQTGDAAVQEALDQLIEHHFDFGEHTSEGSTEQGAKSGTYFDSTGTPMDIEVVSLGGNGQPAAEPVLVSNIPNTSLRIPPGKAVSLSITSAPANAWKALETIDIYAEPSIRGLEVRLDKESNHATVTCEFSEPDDFEEDSYPIETNIRIIGIFKDLNEPRLLEKTLIIRRSTKRPPPPPSVLLDVPTWLRIMTRQPVRLMAGGPDTHVKLRWNGKDGLAEGVMPPWKFRASCVTNGGFPVPTFTLPRNGRFEVLVHTPAETLAGTKLTFEVLASGPSGSALSAQFEAEVIVLPIPQKSTVKLPTKGQRKPPYKVLYVDESSFQFATRWGDETWNETHAGAFMEPKETSPLTLCINQDFGLLRGYVDGLVAKKADEQRTAEKKTKYVSHIAYHLYQMYLNVEEMKKQKDSPDSTEIHIPDDEEMQLEINRVAATLIRLMEVSR